MPVNPRVRNNNVRGTLTDNPLLIGALTMNSAGLANLEAIATEHAIITIDPLRVAGAPEHVIVTAHTGAATSATITRAAYGSTAREHALGTLWVHASLTDDFIRIVNATADITDPYEGQIVYEQDVDIYHAYTGAAWIEALPLGAWQTYTPTNVNVTIGNGTQTAKFARTGKIIHWKYTLTWGSTTSFGGTVDIGLPVSSTTEQRVMAHGEARDSGTATHVLVAVFINATTVRPIADGDSLINATVPYTWAVNDTLSLWGTYEAA